MFEQSWVAVHSFFKHVTKHVSDSFEDKTSDRSYGIHLSHLHMTLSTNCMASAHKAAAPRIAKEN